MDVASLKTVANQIGYFIVIVFECALIAVVVLAILVGLAWIYFEGLALLDGWISKKKRIRARKAEKNDSR